MDGMAAVVAKPWWRETVETILWALVLALILRTFVVQAFWIPSGSMVPTLLPGDRVLVAKFWYWFQEPKRGQIMVFKYPVDPQRDFVKRIVGLPGDVIEVRDGVVIVNGTSLSEPYVRNRDMFTLTESTVFPKIPFTVPKDSFFVMGDNRPNSQDSRFWGFVPKQNVRGPAFVRYWPLDRLGLME
jgi:signal peptidase I